MTIKTISKQFYALIKSCYRDEPFEKLAEKSQVASMLNFLMNKKKIQGIITIEQLKYIDSIVMSNCDLDTIRLFNLNNIHVMDHCSESVLEIKTGMYWNISTRTCSAMDLIAIQFLLQTDSIKNIALNCMEISGNIFDTL